MNEVTVEEYHSGFKVSREILEGDVFDFEGIRSRKEFKELLEPL